MSRDNTKARESILEEDLAKNVSLSLHNSFCLNREARVKALPNQAKRLQEQREWMRSYEQLKAWEEIVISSDDEEELLRQFAASSTVSRWFGPCSGGEARTCGFSQIAKFKPGGGEEPDSVFSLGHTVGRYFTRQQLTHGVADHGGKLQAINIPTSPASSTSGCSTSKAKSMR